MIDATLTTAQKVLEFLKVGGPYAIMVIEGYVIWRLWLKIEELHAKLERKR